MLFSCEYANTVPFHCHICPPFLIPPNRSAAVGKMTTILKWFHMCIFVLSAQGHQVVIPVTEIVCDTERAFKGF